ncbi:MAG TPA: TonB family protein [Noviherbaspirillum sp.]|nr:TonB family protein [Noviherbaspirillum sp.]
MINTLCGTGHVKAKDWVISAGFHIALVLSVGWGLSHSALLAPADKPLDLSVSWAAEASPPSEPAPPVALEQPQQQQKTAVQRLPSPDLPAPASVAQPEQPAPSATPEVPTPASVASAPADVAARTEIPPSTVSAETAPPVNVPHPAIKTSELPRWQGQLESLLAKYKHYPRASQRMRQEGVVTVEAHFSAAGEVVRCEVVGTSGFKALDEAALQLVRQAADTLRTRQQPGRATELRIPVVYELTES